MTAEELDMIVRTLTAHADGAVKMADMLSDLYARVAEIEQRLALLEAPVPEVMQ